MDGHGIYGITWSHGLFSVCRSPFLDTTWGTKRFGVERSPTSHGAERQRWSPCASQPGISNHSLKNHPKNTKPCQKGFQSQNPKLSQKIQVQKWPPPPYPCITVLQHGLDHVMPEVVFAKVKGLDMIHRSKDDKKTSKSPTRGPILIRIHPPTVCIGQVAFPDASTVAGQQTGDQCQTSSRSSSSVSMSFWVLSWGIGGKVQMIARCEHVSSIYSMNSTGVVSLVFISVVRRLAGSDIQLCRSSIYWIFVANPLSKRAKDSE